LVPLASVMRYNKIVIGTKYEIKKRSENKWLKNVDAVVVALRSNP
jgi:hypothetical protein